jgi:hypothetical protein
MDSEPSRWARVVGWLGLVAHAGTFAWYASSGLLAPGWAVAGLLVLWLALLLAGVWLRRNRPLLTPLVPVASIACWLLVIWAGSTWLGWSA